MTKNFIIFKIRVTYFRISKFISNFQCQYGPVYIFYTEEFPADLNARDQYII